MSEICDKCGQPVPPENNLAHFLSQHRAVGLLALGVTARHVLPVPGCEGSPSRAQYLPGQPRDARYPYDEKLEADFRDAWERLQRETVGMDRRLRR